MFRAELKQDILLRHHVDKVFELVRDREIPQRYREHQYVRLMQLGRQGFQCRPGDALLVAQCHAAEARILGVHHRPIEFRQVEGPHIQGHHVGVRGVLLITLDKLAGDFQGCGALFAG